MHFGRFLNRNLPTPWLSSQEGLREQNDRPRGKLAAHTSLLIVNSSLLFSDFTFKDGSYLAFVQLLTPYQACLSPQAVIAFHLWPQETFC